MSLIRNLLNEVRFFLKGDPYHRTVDNRPLTDLNTNVSAVTDASDVLVTSQSVLSTAIGSVLRGYAKHNSAAGKLQYNADLTITVIRAIASADDSVTTNTHAVPIAKVALASVPQVLAFSNTGIPAGYARPYSVQAYWTAEDATLPGFDPADPGTTAQYKTLFPEVNAIKVLRFAVIAGSDQVVGSSYTYPPLTSGYIEVFRVLVAYGQTVLTSDDVTLTGWWEEGGSTDDDPFLTLSRAYANGIDRDLALTGNALGAADLNTANAVGEYSFDGPDLTGHRPFLKGVLKVMQKGTSLTQDAHSLTDSSTASRTFDGTVWSDWLVQAPVSRGFSDTLLAFAHGIGITDTQVIPSKARSATILAVGCGGPGGDTGAYLATPPDFPGTGGGGGPGSSVLITLMGDISGYTVRSVLGTPWAPLNTHAGGYDDSAGPGGAVEAYLPVYPGHEPSGSHNMPALSPLSASSLVEVLDRNGKIVLRIGLPAGERGGLGYITSNSGDVPGGGGGKRLPAQVLAHDMGPGVTWAIRDMAYDDFLPTGSMVGVTDGTTPFWFDGNKGDYVVVTNSFVDPTGVPRQRGDLIARVRGTYNDNSTNDHMAYIRSNDPTCYTGPLAYSRGGSGGRAGERGMTSPAVSVGLWDLSSTTGYPTTGSGGGGAILAGDYWTIQGSGRIGKFYYENGYLLIADVNAPGQDTEKWGSSSAGAAATIPASVAAQVAPFLAITAERVPGPYGYGGRGQHFSLTRNVASLMAATAGGPASVLILTGEAPA